jgi:photosystem II stability/assembly factor-like uncharacterized protein
MLGHRFITPFVVKRMTTARVRATPQTRWRSSLAILCGLIWAVWAPSLFAQSPVTYWQPLAGPPGRISLLAQDPTDQTLYAVAVSAVHLGDGLTQWQDKGAWRQSHALYLSTDRGVTWQPATNNLVYGAITALYADAVSGNVLAGLTQAGDALTRRDGLWRSDDRGAHWRPVDLERNDLTIRRITRNADGSLLLLGAISADSQPSSYVYLSRDDGASWQTVEALHNEQDSEDILCDLVAHPKDPARLFVTTCEGNLYDSEDGGETWEIAPLPPIMQSTNHPGPAALAIDPARPDQLLLVRNLDTGPAAQVVIARSQDEGASWQRVAAGGLQSGLPERGEIVSLAATGSGVYLLSLGTGSYRSTDQGTTWQPLEGFLSSGSVTAFLSLTEPSRAILAASGYGLFVSHDDGGLWQYVGSGLPANLAMLGMLTDARQPGLIFAIPDRAALFGAAKPPGVLRSNDSGRTWMAAAQGLPDAQINAWALDINAPNALLVAADGFFGSSADGGFSWRVSALPPGPRPALAQSLFDPEVVYLGGNPLLRSSDHGLTWQALPVALSKGEPQPGNVTGIVVDPMDARHLWASMEDGVYESQDAGGVWRRSGLDGKRVRWLTGIVQPGGTGVALEIFAGVEREGLYRWSAQSPSWTPVSTGLPGDSTLLSLHASLEDPGMLWTSRDGGGLYRSLDGGESWSSIGGALGDNLVTAVATDSQDPSRILAATATAGIWREATPATNTSLDASRSTVDARIEILWPHDWAPVSEAKQANISLRLFKTRSLLPPTCTWSPDISVWRATNNEPATPIGRADQRAVQGAPFPVWDLNDIDVSRANDPNTKLYFMVRAAGTDLASSVWAHAADARTFLPFPAQPSGIAAPDALRAVDTYIQIVWPHDESGNPQPAETATLANVAVAIFEHGTRLSAPASWRPRNVTLYGAWDHEIAQPLSRQSAMLMKTAGAITYPVWEFTNIPVERATDPGSKLYLWALVEGIETYPAVWAHGADARTLFPATDQPIQGCLP